MFWLGIGHEPEPTSEIEYLFSRALQTEGVEKPVEAISAQRLAASIAPEVMFPIIETGLVGKTEETVLGAVETRGGSYKVRAVLLGA